MAHTLPIDIIPGRQTAAYYLASGAPKNIVVFVHGFKGHAITTWKDFPDLIHGSKMFDESDVIFYGYPSLEQQANAHALDFVNFLKDHVENIVMRNYFTQQKLPKEFKYKKVILIAHSLGAIVVRRALLDIYKLKPKSSLLGKIDMILFAPAHRGTLVETGYFTATGGIGAILGVIGLVNVPVLQNLQPNSGTIQDLIKETDVLRKGKQGGFTIAKKVVWASTDKIVYQDHFDPKEVPIKLDDTDHMSVCKPRNNKWLVPADIIQQFL